MLLYSSNATLRNLISYVCKGSKPFVRHHYRGAKLALWLDLIPRIHRSDNLNVRYHLLDHYDNRSSFEDEGTKELRLNDDDVQDTTMTSAAAAATSENSASMTTATVPHPQ